MKTFAISFILFSTGILLMLVILFIEYNAELPIGTVSYLLVTIGMLWFLRTSKYIIVTGIFTSVLLLSIFYVKVGEVELNTNSTINRMLSLVVVWVIVFFTIRFKKLYRIEKKENRQLYALVKNANEGILLLDVRGRILVANPSTEKYCRRDASELIGNVFWDVLPVEYSLKYQQGFDLYLKEHVSRSFLMTIRSKNKKGEELYLDISHSYFYDQAEMVIIAFMLDSTKRNKNETLIRTHLDQANDHNVALEQKVKQRTKDLELSNQQLLKSQLLYKAMAQNFPDGIIGVMDRDMKYVLVDGKGLEELGIELNRLAVGEDKIMDQIHSVITSSVEDTLKKVFEGNSLSLDFQLQNKYYNVSSAPICDPDGSINLIMIVVKNISAQKNLEGKLLKTLEDEKELNILKSKFVTMASHEFRTPLTTILSSAYLIEQYNGPQNIFERKKHIDRIRRSVHNLTELLSDFLSLARLEEGMEQTNYNEFELYPFVEEILLDVSSIKKENQKLVMNFDGAEIAVLMDKLFLRNILINLLSNAIKYSPDFGTINLSIFLNDDLLTIQVSDHGIGIPLEEQKFVFERFFRANNTSDFQGTGLGLNIVRRYVTLLKGKIDFVSEVNKGTVFTVDLPLKNVNELTFN